MPTSGGGVISQNGIDPALLDVADRVCSALLRECEGLAAEDLMLVGAHCRDALQSSQGQVFRLRATDDVDVAIALANWEAYDRLLSRLTRRGDTGIQFDVDGARTDLLPFGTVEEPTGLVTPPTRGEAMSVWGFVEVFDDASPLVLPTAGTIRIPTVPGYVALKLGAWLDRSAYGQYKDASDIAAALHWYAESSGVLDRLYSDGSGEELMVAYDVDPARGAANLLGRDVADVLGPARHAELLERWPATRGAWLAVEMNLPAAAGWPAEVQRRKERLHAFEDGLGLPQTP